MIADMAGTPALDNARNPKLGQCGTVLNAEELGLCGSPCKLGEVGKNQKPLTKLEMELSREKQPHFRSTLLRVQPVVRRSREL